MTWEQRAACQPYPLPVFHPDEISGRPRNGPDPYAQARTVCAICTVAAPCLAAALTEPLQAGMRAGLTPKERKDMIRATGRRVNAAPEHGLSAYRHHRCRCDECRAANAKYKRGLWAMKRSTS